MDWLFPSVIATLAGTLVLAGTYLYLYSHDRQRFLLIWGSGWLSYAARDIFTLLSLARSPLFNPTLLVIANQLAALVSGILLLWGTYVFMRRSFPRAWLIFTLVNACWIIGASMAKLSFAAQTISTYFFLGLVYIWTGIVIVRHYQIRGAGRNFTACAFILWGLHKLDYPFLRPIVWFAPWGYLLAATLEITVAIGMLLIYFESTREALAENITVLRNALNQLRMALFSIEKTAMEIFWTTEDAHFIYVNEFACRSLGYSREELLTLTVFDIDPDFTREMWAQHWETLRSKGAESVQTRHRRKDGTSFPVEVTANFQVYEGQGYNFAYAKDISERYRAEEEKLRLEEQVRRAQKMEALGTLAGGIAHDFNNILGVILGYAEIVKDDTPPDSTTSKDMDKVLAAGYRARDLVQKILAFSRQAPVERIPLRPGAIIREALAMLRASLPSTIAIHEDIASDCGMVCADPIQLHQIMMNLGTNAFHAMETTGGSLRVKMKTAETVPEVLLQLEGSAGKKFVRLSVEDTGCGISPEIMDKIFDPFFTTKELGKGTGMGLSMVYGIVHDYGGTIVVDSRPGQGTTFHVYLPCCDRSESEIESGSPESAARGQGHILLVDDEQMLGEMSRTLLERLGYQVTLFTRSPDALEAFRNDPAQFDLVITDQTMPAMTGIDLARSILQLRPDFPIILCSGYSNLVNEETARAAGIKAFALKPLTRGTLSHLIRSVLVSGNQSVL